MRTKSTELMDKIIEVVDDEYSKSGRTPTMQEIGNSLNISKASVSNYIAEMQKRGLITNNSGSRGIMTKAMQKSQTTVIKVPVVGTIACGTFILAQENIDRYLPIPQEFLGHGEYFILKAQGDSMIDANINDGDYVVVKQQDTAEIGQIVVALIENEATLKRYYKDKNNHKVRLHPENSSMTDMFFDNIVIQGVATKVIKNLL